MLAGAQFAVVKSWKVTVPVGVPKPVGFAKSAMTIFCPVKYNTTTKTCTDGGVPANLKTFVTAGGTALTSPDCISGAAGCTAAASQMTQSAGDQSFTITLPTAVTVSTGQTKQIDMYFNPNAACELWDISTLKSHAAGTDFKIVPGSQSPSQAKVP